MIITFKNKTTTEKNSRNSIQTIDDFFPFEEETNEVFLKDTQQELHSTLCPNMLSIHLTKQSGKYLLYGTCKCDNKMCEYQPVYYSPSECPVALALKKKEQDKINDTRYAMFCLGK